MRTHLICKTDLTEYAAKELGLWGSLTDDNDRAFEVEVQVVAMTDENGRRLFPKEAK